MHGVAVGIDVAKDFHWVQAVDRRASEIAFSGRVDNTPPALGAFVEQLEVLRARGPVTVVIDVVGGIASVLTAMLLDAAIEVVHVPGLAVNRPVRGPAAASTRATRCRGDRRPGAPSPRSAGDRGARRAGRRDSAA